MANGIILMLVGVSIRIRVEHVLNTVKMEGQRRNVKTASHQVQLMENPDNKLKAGVGGKGSGVHR